MVSSLLALIFLLLAAHFVADYPLQGDFLSRAKAEGPLRRYHLFAHSGIQAAGVFIVTGVVWLGLLEWAAHYFIDDAKVRGLTTFQQDQVFHIVCKLMWAALFLIFVNQSLPWI